MPPLCFELSDPAHWQKPIGERRQCRNIVSDHRSPDTKAQCKHASNAGNIGTKDHQPAVADISVEVAGNITQLTQFAEALLHEYDMRRISGDRSCAAQRNRDVGFLQCDRVVNAIADKADLATFSLQLFNVIGLVGGQHLSKVAVHPELIGEPAGWRLVVARDDRNMSDVAVPQALDDAANLGSYR